MAEESQITALIATIKESDKQNREEMAELRDSIKEMSKSFQKYYEHMILYEEDKKHDAKFKEETREFIKNSTPLLNYVSEQKSITGKMKTAFYVALMFSLFALLGFNIK